MKRTPCAECPFLEERVVIGVDFDSYKPRKLTNISCKLGDVTFPDDILIDVASDCPCLDNESKKEYYKAAKILDRYIDEYSHLFTPETYKAFNIAEKVLIKLVDSGGNIS